MGLVELLNHRFNAFGSDRRMTRAWNYMMVRWLSLPLFTPSDLARALDFARTRLSQRLE